MKRRRCWWCGHSVIDGYVGRNFSCTRCKHCGQRTPVASRPVVSSSCGCADVYLGGVEMGGAWRVSPRGPWRGEFGRWGVTADHPTRRAAVLWVKRQLANWLYRNVGG